MRSGWQEIGSARDLVDGLELNGVGTPSMAMLLRAPRADRYLRAAGEPELPPGHFGYVLPGRRYFFNVTACREFWGDAMVALAAFLATQSAPAAAAATAFRKLYDNLARLSAEEGELVRAVLRASTGNPYETPVAEADVRLAFRGPPEDVDDLLDALQSKGVISGRRGNRIQLVF